jgi:hypothetical protein
MDSKSVDMYMPAQALITLYNAALDRMKAAWSWKALMGPQHNAAKRCNICTYADAEAWTDFETVTIMV